MILFLTALFPSFLVPLYKFLEPSYSWVWGRRVVSVVVLMMVAWVGVDIPIPITCRADHVILIVARSQVLVEYGAVGT